MTPDACREWRPMLGAYVLGHLDPTERRAFEAHLEGCPDCRREVEELRPVGRALTYADPEHVTAEPTGPPSDLEEKVFDRLGRERLRRRRRWTALIAAALVIAVAGVATAWLVRPAPEPEGTLLAMSGEIEGVEATARLEPRGWGTFIRLETTGLPPDDYEVWLRTDDGTRVPAGTFRGVEGARMQMDLASAAQREDVHSFWVTTDDGTVLKADVPTEG